MTPDLLLAILTALSLGTLIPAVVTAVLNRRAASEQAKLEYQKSQSESTSELTQARIDDASKARAELWEQLQRINDKQAAQLQTAVDRNDALSQRYGVILQEKATLFAENESLKSQNVVLVGRLTTEQQKTEESVYRQRQTEQALEQSERQLAAANERIQNLLQQIELVGQVAIKSQASATVPNAPASEETA